MIVAVPAATPDTTPDVEFTLAVPEALLVHTPPVGDEDNVVVDPVHTESVPEIAEGAALTVTTLVAKQPPAKVYVIVAVPVATPDTTPEVELTLAVPEALLVHTPPVGDDDNVVVDPTQTAAVPDIAPGVVLTVTTAVTKHPLLNV